MEQPITLECEAVPLQVFTETSRLIPLSKFKLLTVGFQNQREWLTVLAVFFICVVFPFRVLPYMVAMY